MCATALPPLAPKPVPPRPTPLPPPSPPNACNSPSQPEPANEPAGRALSSGRPGLERQPMAEAFNEIVLPQSKADRYAVVAEEIGAVLDGETNVTAQMATIASMLAASFD